MATPSAKRISWWVYTARLLVLAFALAGVCVLAVGHALSRAVPRIIGPPPADLGAHSVSIERADGAPSAGWFARGLERSGAVLLLHSVRSDRLQMLSRARVLHDAGYSVLLIDFPAHGESAGSRITFGAHKAEGVKTALGFLRTAAPRERIGVIGVSLGAASLVLAHPRPAPDAVILESMYPTIENAVRDRLAMRLGRVGPLFAPLLLSQLPLWTGVTPAQLRPRNALHDLRAPLLLMSGTRDRHTPPAEISTLAAAAAASGPVRTQFASGAAHVDLEAFDPEAYYACVMPFLATHLRR